MNRKIVLIGLAAGMLSLTACGKKEEVSDVTVADVVTTVAQDVVNSSITPIELKGDELNDGSAIDKEPEIDEDFGGNEADVPDGGIVATDENEESETYESQTADGGPNDGAVLENGTLTEIGVLTSIDGNSYLIDIDGMPVEAITDDNTVLEEGLVVNESVILVTNGIKTRSIPAQAVVVYSISKLYTDDTRTADLIDTDVSPENVGVHNVEFHGVVTEISDLEVVFDVENRGIIVANISEITDMGDGIEVGSNIVVESSEVMTMSEPPILPEVYTIKLAE